MEQIPRWVHWTVLVAMVAVVLWRISSGFDEPREIVSGCLAAAAAAWAARALWIQRRDGPA